MQKSSLTVDLFVHGFIPCVHVCLRCVQAVIAETSTVKADSVAAAAMKAAETAVMEEMQAAAVVKVTMSSEG